MPAASSSVIVRRYRPADQSSVIRIFRDFMHEVTPAGREEDFQRYVARAVTEELEQIEDYYSDDRGSRFWVAEDQTVVGMVGVERKDEGTAELRRMAVTQSRRRQGIGTTLLMAAEHFCIDRGYRVLVLTTSELQQAAARLYEAAGFTLIDVSTSVPPSHRNVGAGLSYLTYKKALS